ncbi:MAG: hypothetical protein ACOYK8_00390 [Alphaproteobacteria bacterium]
MLGVGVPAPYEGQAHGEYFDAVKAYAEKPAKAAEVQTISPVITTTAANNSDGGLFGFKNGGLSQYLEPINPYEAPYEQYSTSMASTDDYTNAWPAKVEKNAIVKPALLPKRPINYVDIKDLDFDHYTTNYKPIQKEAALGIINNEKLTSNFYWSGKESSGPTIAGGFDVGPKNRREVRNIGLNAGLPENEISILEQGAGFQNNQTINPLLTNKRLHDFDLKREQIVPLTMASIDYETERLKKVMADKGWYNDQQKIAQEKAYQVAFDYVYQNGRNSIGHIAHFLKNDDHRGFLNHILAHSGPQENEINYLNDLLNKNNMRDARDYLGQLQKKYIGYKSERALKYRAPLLLNAIINNQEEYP